MPSRSGLRRPVAGVSDTAEAYGAMRPDEPRRSGAEEDRDPDARGGPEGAGQRAQDEALGRGRRLPQLVVAAEPLDGEDDGQALRPVGEQRPRDRGPLEHTDP